MSSNSVYSDRIFSVALLVITILIVIAGGALWYYTSRQSDFSHAKNALRQFPSNPTTSSSDFEATYNELGIQPLPSSIEGQQRISSRLAQLHREPCYRDAIIGLGRALLDAGYPREAATGLRSFVKRCGGAPEILPLAFTGLERINDFSAALEVANELVEAVPASGSFRYWRALAYDRSGKFSQAMVDYMNAIQLFGDPKTVPGHVFYEWAQSYAALGRYCDAISPIEIYISIPQSGELRKRQRSSAITPKEATAPNVMRPVRRAFRLQLGWAFAR
jgi:tetratricopeptide (TPR) repeat protein